MKSYDVHRIWHGSPITKNRLIWCGKTWSKEEKKDLRRIKKSKLTVYQAHWQRRRAVCRRRAKHACTRQQSYRLILTNRHAKTRRLIFDPKQQFVWALSAALHCTPFDTRKDGAGLRAIFQAMSNWPYLYPRFWPGTSLQLRLMQRIFSKADDINFISPKGTQSAWDRTDLDTSFLTLKRVNPTWN